MTTTLKEEADGYKSLGNEAFNQKDYKKSIELYTRAISLYQNNHIYYSNRSASYAALAQWQSAEEDARSCIEMKPSFAKGYARLANAQRHGGKEKEALLTLEEGKKVDSTSPDINALLREMTSNDKTKNTIAPAIAAELSVLQPQYKSIVRELEQVHIQYYSQWY